MKKRIKIRRVWKIDPVEQVVQSKKRYNRNEEKRQLGKLEY